MPLSISSSERRSLLAFGAVCLVIILVVLILAPKNQDDPGYPSSTSTHSKGALATFLTLQESGYQVQRWYRPPEELPTNGHDTTLILAEPFPSSNPQDKDQVLRYVSTGGRVLAIGWAAGFLLPRNNVEFLHPARGEWKQARPVIPSRLTRGGPFTADQALKWDVRSPDEVIHFESDDGPAVVSYRYGKGEVIWWASAVPLLNGGVEKPGNLELLLGSVGEPGRRILWDEYFHSTHHSLYATVADTPLKFLVWQFLFFAGLVVLTYSRRSGPLRPLPERSRLSPLEFIETLGGLYQRFRTPGLAVEIAYERFRHLLMRRTGLKADAPVELVDKVAREKLHFEQKQFLDDLRRSQTAQYSHDLSGKEALSIVQRLSTYEAELLGTRTSGGKH